MWECKLVGIIVRDGDSSALAVDKLVFLSITIEPVMHGFALHQHAYVQTKLANRAVTKGRPSLPEADEGHWLALKTRPDIACIAAICASMQSRNPQKALDINGEIWKYIKSTAYYVMNLAPNAEAENDIRISADASFAPGGDRSRTGVVIKVLDAI
eukprot:3149121-Lingulodinium_polyedra.AAC.1